MPETLIDNSGGKRTVPVTVKTEGTGAGLVICPAGYGCCNCQDGTTGPMYLEIYEGRLRLLVWSDINQEDPTHILDLESAREDQRLDP